MLTLGGVAQSAHDAPMAAVLNLRHNQRVLDTNRGKVSSQELFVHKIFVNKLQHSKQTIPHLRYNHVELYCRQRHGGDAEGAVRGNQAA